MTFAERRRLELDYKEWLKRESIASGVAVEDCALTVIGYLDCERLINKMPRWIPVSERLPDMGKYVLCSVDKNHVYESDLEVVITQFRNEGWWTDGRINAWMPLPEPYKEGE